MGRPPAKGKSVGGFWDVLRLEGKNGTARYVTNNHWRHTVAFDAMCEDGKVRRVRAQQSPDTFFSHPGRVTFPGKVTRNGYVTDADGEFQFRAYPLAEDQIASYEAAGFDNCKKVGRYLVRVDCSQCAVTKIQGIFCHETGCPNEARAKRIAMQDEWEEDECCTL